MAQPSASTRAFDALPRSRLQFTHRLEMFPTCRNEIQIFAYLRIEETDGLGLVFFPMKLFLASNILFMTNIYSI